MQFGAAAGFPSSLSATWTFNSSTSSFCSKSQIRIAGPQAAQSQYRFGLNTRVLISLAPSKLHLSSPNVFQSLIVLSRPAEMICRLSAEKATESTSCLWPVNRVVVIPRSRSQSRRVLSQEAETAN